MISSLEEIQTSRRFSQLKELVREFEVTLGEDTYRGRILRSVGGAAPIYWPQCLEKKDVPLKRASIREGDSVEVFVPMPEFEVFGHESEDAAIHSIFKFLGRHVGTRELAALDGSSTFG